MASLVWSVLSIAWTLEALGKYEVIDNVFWP